MSQEPSSKQPKATNQILPEETHARTKTRAQLQGHIMPYHVIKSGNGYKVQNKDTGKTYSNKPMTKEKAEAQMRAMYANINEEGTLIDKLSKVFEIHFNAFNVQKANSSNQKPEKPTS